MQMMCSVTSNVIADLILSTKNRFILAAPGIQKKVAKAIISKSKELHENNFKVILDTSEEVCRLGYGDITSIEMLNENNIRLFQSPGLRIGILICDNDAWIYSPTALYIQSEAQSSETPNAIHVDSSIANALAIRLSEIERQKALNSSDIQQELPDKIEIGNFTLTEPELRTVKQNLEQAPPIPFDIARQVRVFEPYIQCVDIKLRGVAIQRKRIKLPHCVVNLGSDKKIQDRINTTFSLIERNSTLSSKELEKELDKIREDFTHSLGSDYGRVMLKSSRKKFDEAVEKFKEKVQQHQDSLKKNLSKYIKDSLQSLIEYYKPVVLEKPPRELSGQITGEKPTEQIAEEWLKDKLGKVFPNPDQLFQEMQVIVHFKDVTYETLKDNKFREQIKEKFKYVDWDKPFKEFQAIGEDEKKSKTIIDNAN